MPTQYYPGTNLVVTSPFPFRSDGITPHGGVDWSNGNSAGVAIFARVDGVARAVTASAGYGQMVRVTTDFGSVGELSITYGHIVPAVTSGQRVVAGDLVGYIGTKAELLSKGGTLGANFSGSHLHEEWLWAGQKVDPRSPPIALQSVLENVGYLQYSNSPGQFNFFGTSTQKADDTSNFSLPTLPPSFSQQLADWSSSSPLNSLGNLSASVSYGFDPSGSLQSQGSSSYGDLTSAYSAFDPVNLLSSPSLSTYNQPVVNYSGLGYVSGPSSFYDAPISGYSSYYDSFSNPYLDSWSAGLDSWAFDYPVALDLDGNGVEIVQAAASAASFDFDGDGYRERSSWIGSGDGFLVIDLGQDGKIDQAKELSLKAWSPTARTDLEGLAQAFDTNRDGVFDAKDARFSEFRVWQDKNGDGVSDAGELRTLAEAGITSIKVTSDNQAVGLADGTISHGLTTWTGADGKTHAVSDLALRYDTNGWRRVDNGDGTFAIDVETGVDLKWRQAKPTEDGISVPVGFGRAKNPFETGLCA